MRNVVKKMGWALFWILLMLEVLSMATAGWGKFEHYDGWRHWFERWGYGAWFSPVIGVVEISGALLLLVPRVASYAAALLIVVMLGAFYTVTTKESDLSWVDPLVHIGLLAVVLAVRWPRRTRASAVAMVRA